MSKDRIERARMRTTPYIAPRRPLHSENGTFTARHVRQANNPACSLPQFLPAGSVFNYEYCNEYIGEVRCVPALRSFYVYNREAVNPANPSLGYKYITCAKVACDNGLPNIQKANKIPFTLNGQTYYRLNDTRCAITKPPYAFTSTSFVNDGNYRYIPGTGAYAVAPLVVSAVAYDGVVKDVDNFRCFDAETDVTIARQIQKEVGLVAGLSAAAGACLLPAPAGAIIAAQTATITGLATVIGLAGSAAVIGGSVYAGYKLVQHCKSKTQVIPDTENTYEEVEMNRQEPTAPDQLTKKESAC